MEPGNAQLSMTVLMTPDMANFSGNVHGGTLLKYLDEVAYACASRYAGRYVVTLSVESGHVVERGPDVRSTVVRTALSDGRAAGVQELANVGGVVCEHG